MEAADEPIRLAPHDPRWGARFESERVLLDDVIGPWAARGIHHVGSTAVSGLDAKPIVDILVGVKNLEIARECFGPLAELGYLHAPYRPREMHWFCKPHPSRREFHLHLVAVESARFRDEIAFRDLLRSKPEIARGYADLKHSLASRFPGDREAYTEAKGAFIFQALDSR